MADFIGPVETNAGRKDIFINRDNVDAFFYDADEKLTYLSFSAYADDSRYKGNITPLLLGRGGKTNGDRLRAMTDEELVEFLYNTGCQNHDFMCKGMDCRDCWREWLEMEATDNV